MSFVINRNFISPILSEAGRQRAREQLISLGYRPEAFKPIVWPEDAVEAYRSYVGAPWEFTTKADIRRRKWKLRENHRIWLESQVTHRRLLYVWVFWCPGVGGFAFRGWWTYIIGCNVEHGGKHSQDSVLISRAMGMFPVVEPTLFGMDWEQRERWMIEFAKRYQRGTWCGKPQGKALVWAEVKGTSIEKILGRAEWASPHGA